MRTRSIFIFNRFGVLAVLVALIASAVYVTPVRAAAIVVNTAADLVNASDGFCSLREAITAANTNTASGAAAGECAAGSGADAISFAANYTITLAPGLGQLPAVTGPVTINGKGTANTVIRAHASANTATMRVFHIGFAGNLTLNALTVRNGRCNGSCTVVTDSGGGIYNAGTLTVTNSVISGNAAIGLGGGVYNSGTLTVTNSVISSNSASVGGSGISSSGVLNVTNSTFSGNTTPGGGGGIYNSGTLTVTNSTFSGNSASVLGGGIQHTGSSTASNVRNSTISGNSAGTFGGGINNSGTLVIMNSTVSTNSAPNGGGIYNGHSLTVTNSTLSANSAPSGFGGGIGNGGTLVVTNSTFSANSALNGGGLYSQIGAATLYNSIVANSPSGFNCVKAATGTFTADGYNLDTDGSCDNAVQRASTEIKLQPLANNGGPTATLALLPGSLAIDAANAAVCPITDQRGTVRPQGTRCDIGAYEKTELIFIEIGASVRHSYSLASGQSQRVSYAGLNSGPVKFENTVPGQHLIASERLIYKVNGVNTSFSEIMGLPVSQLNTMYWLPYYNNADLGTQLLVGNVSNSPATVHVYIGGVEMPGSPFTLAARTGTSKSFPAVNNGPVKIQSNVNIVASERVTYPINGINRSSTEMMALPDSQLNTVYWLPYYNNVDLDTQLRFANVSTSTATVSVSIGGVAMPGSPFTLAPGAGTRKSFPGVNNGPVRIQSNVNIVAAERVIYKVNGVNTSFSELMALPNSQLNTIYWFPYYNNVDLDTQLRIANVSGSTATVHIFIGGVEMAGSPFSLAAGASARKSFPGVNNGPVRIQSNVNIVAAERVIYKVNGVNTSFTEIMGLPDSLLGTIYWMPWYNNVDLDTQLRFGVP